MRNGSVYLDNNASTRVREEVLAAMLPWFTESWGNASSSIHSAGRAARAAIDNARNEVAAFLRCESDEVIFTSGASEANALAIGGARPGGRPPDRVVTADIEHQSVLSSCFLAQDGGAVLDVVRVSAGGYVSEAALAQLPLTQRSIVSVQWVNNETGAINPIADIGGVVKGRGALLHVDAAQAPGKADIDLQSIPIDLLTISGHKFHGPKGIGALFVRRGTPLEPLIRGGHQERGRRAGTENVPAIAGLGEACRLARLEGSSHRATIGALRDRLERRLRDEVPGTIVIKPAGPRADNTSICAWDGLSNRALLRALDAAAICAASGSACTSESDGPSHVLRAMNVEPSVARSAIRISFGRDNTEEETDYVVDTLAEVVEHLRS
jgi:cysteine desulfurase